LIIICLRINFKHKLYLIHFVKVPFIQDAGRWYINIRLKNLNERQNQHVHFSTNLEREHERYNGNIIQNPDIKIIYIFILKTIIFLFNKNVKNNKSIILICYDMILEK
jgi:hypothetical protein